MQPTPVRRAADELGLPVWAPERARDPEFIASVRALDADVLVVAAYGQILRPRLLEAARRGAINLHGSILPRWRGAAPVARALLEGDTVTGVTLMQMDAGMDTGDMIAVRTAKIGDSETAGDVMMRLADLAADLSREWLPRIAAGDHPRTPQPAEGVRMAPKVDKSEARLDVARPALAEFRRFRAFTPAPGAWIETRWGPMRISRAAHRADSLIGPGNALATERGLLVGFAGGALELLEVQPAGKRRMSGRDAANGWRLADGGTLV